MRSNYTHLHNLAVQILSAVLCLAISLSTSIAIGYENLGLVRSAEKTGSHLFEKALAEFNRTHEGVFVELNPNAKFEIPPEECLKILDELYEEGHYAEDGSWQTGFGLQDVRITLDRFTILRPVVEPIDVVPYYDETKKADRMRYCSDPGGPGWEEVPEICKNSNNIPIDIVINTRAFEKEDGLAKLEDALRNAIRDHQEKPVGEPESVEGYTKKRDKEHRRLKRWDWNPYYGTFRPLNHCRTWSMAFALWKHGLEKHYLKKQQASADPELVNMQVDEFIALIEEQQAAGYITEKDDIVATDISAGDCEHPDLWLQTFLEKAPEQWHKRLIFIVSEVNLADLEISIKAKPRLVANARKIKRFIPMRIDLNEIIYYNSPDLDSTLGVDRSVLEYLNRSSLLMISYSLNITPYYLVSKRNGVLYERLSREYLSPTFFDSTFFAKWRRHLDEIGVTGWGSKLREFLEDEERYEELLTKVASMDDGPERKNWETFIEELARGIKIEFRCAKGSYDMLLEEEFLEEMPDQSTEPIHWQFCNTLWAFAWITYKGRGITYVLDTVDPSAGRRPLARYGKTVAGWISPRYLEWQVATDAMAARANDKDITMQLTPIRDIAEQKDAGGALLTMRVRHISEPAAPITVKQLRETFYSA